MQQLIRIAIVGLCLAGITSPAPAADEARQAYDKMVEDASREADEYLKEKADERKEAEAAAEEQENSQLDDRVQAEQERITREMNDIQQRGLSSTFTQGMKDNLLKIQEEKLNALLSDPETYFSAQ